MKKIRTGVIGVGSLGQHHARLYSTLENVDLTCVVDISENGRKIAEKYGVEFFTDYKKILENVDAVSIAVPTTLHYEIAKFMLENNKHVLLEKPITATVEEAEELLNIHKKRPYLIFQIGHIERFNVAIQKLQELKRRGPLFIEANRLGPFTARSTDISVTLDLMIHDIDIILQLVNSRVKNINAIGVPILTDKTDLANARLEFENGTVANVTASRVSPKKLRKIRVFERNAYISIDYIRQSIKIYQLKENLPNDKQISWNDMMETEVFPMDKEEPLAKELKSFINSILNKTQPEVTAYQAYEALKIVSIIEEKIRHTGNKN